MAAMARAGDGANMAGKVGEALAAVGVEPQGSFYPQRWWNKKGENRFKTWIFLELEILNKSCRSQSHRNFCW